MCLFNPHFLNEKAAKTRMKPWIETLTSIIYQVRMRMCVRVSVCGTKISEHIFEG